MDTFHKLFGSLLVFVSHCFDRIVIQGYLPLLTREEHIVHFFRDVHGIYPITKQALAARTQAYQAWRRAYSPAIMPPLSSMPPSDASRAIFPRFGLALPPLRLWHWLALALCLV